MLCWRGLWLVATFSVATLGAAGNDAPLADAVQRRDTQAVLSLLKTHADVNAPQTDGATALHWAAYFEDAETAALLIRAGAKVDTANNYGVTPLSLAAGNGNAAVIGQLLKGGADPNGAVRAGETPLMLAARTGKVDAVKVLLSAGAKVDAKETWNGQTALMWAAAAGHGPVVKCWSNRGDFTLGPTVARRLSCLRCGEAIWLPSAHWWQRAPTSKRRDLTARRRCSWR